MDIRVFRSSFDCFTDLPISKPIVEQIPHSAFTTTRSQLNISLNELRSRLDLLSTVLTNCISATDNAIHFDNSMDPVIFSKLVKILILFRQHELCVMDITKSLVDAKTTIDVSLKAFQDQLRRIHELVKFRTAIPTDKIFVMILWLLCNTKNNFQDF